MTAEGGGTAGRESAPSPRLRGEGGGRGARRARRAPASGAGSRLAGTEARPTPVEEAVRGAVSGLRDATVPVHVRGSVGTRRVGLTRAPGQPGGGSVGVAIGAGGSAGAGSGGGTS